MPFARVKDMKVVAAHRGEDRRDRSDRRAGQGEIIAHAIDVATDAAKISLHVDHDERGIRWPQIAVIRPRIRIGGNTSFSHRGHPLLALSSIVGLKCHANEERVG
jgi:hypothetical protein